MQEKINLAIIGGGASGLIAAITASKICKQTKQITIFEGASRVGPAPEWYSDAQCL